MASDQQVSARAVLDAVMELRRLGTRRALEQLEQVEPDLTSYLLETLTDVHQQILALGAPPRKSRRLFREVEVMTLVCITALRKGHFELWRQTDTGAGLEGEDDAGGNPSSPSDDTDHHDDDESDADVL